MSSSSALDLGFSSPSLGTWPTPGARVLLQINLKLMKQRELGLFNDSF